VVLEPHVELPGRQGSEGNGKGKGTRGIRESRKEKRDKNKSQMKLHEEMK
jgi:hypothetical protein